MSRSRFWGTPLPIWQSEDGEERVVVSSIKELEELSGATVGRGSQRKTAPGFHRGAP